MAGPRVLVIESEVLLRLHVQRCLQEQGCAVDLCTTARSGAARLSDDSADVVVLAGELGDGDGLALLTEARARETRARILVVSTRNEVEDRVRGLQLGADDYLGKPFALAELAARVLALGRRSRSRRLQLVVGALTIDRTSHTVLRDGQPLALSPRQYALLEFLALHEGEASSRATIAERVFGTTEQSSNLVDVHIAALRHSIDQPGRPSLITTVRGVGYRLEAAPTDRNDRRAQ